MQQIKTKFVFLDKIVRKIWKREINFPFVLATVIGLLAPFMHVIYSGDRDVKGNFFGFRYMSAFLFAIGFPISFVCFGIILRFLSDDLVNLKKPALIISHLFIFIGAYYILWAVWPRLDFPSEVYFSMMFAVAIMITIFIDYLNRFTPNVRKLRRTVNYLMDVIVNKTRTHGHVKDERDYVKDIVEPTIDFLDKSKDLID